MSSGTVGNLLFGVSVYVHALLAKNASCVITTDDPITNNRNLIYAEIRMEGISDFGHLSQTGPCSNSYVLVPVWFGSFCI